MNNPLYQISNLKFSYNSKPVLDIKNLVLEKGNIYTFLGENGSGKTTLLKIMNGLLESSDLLFEGSSNQQNIRNKTVYVHQNPFLLKGTVFYNIAFGLKLRQESDLKNKVKNALEIVGLEGFENRKSRDISGGEIQRVAIARALVLNPEVLLLDEPTANIDRKMVTRFSDILNKIRKNTTVIISTHDHHFAYHVGDEMIHLENGRIQPDEENVFKGKTEEQNEGFTFFRTNDVILKCPALEGNFNTAVIDYKDVILSNNKIETSARNNFQGTVLDIRNVKNLYVVTLDIGVHISTLITEKSLKSFDIKKGKKMFLAFKTSAVKLY